MHPVPRCVSRVSLDDYEHCAVLFASRPYRDFNVLAKSGQEVHEAFDREGAGAIAHQ